MNDRNDALEQANAQMRSVREMVTRLELDWERLEELRDAAKAGCWVAGWNMPGYMPDGEPGRFADWDAARDYIVDELERAADDYREACTIPGVEAAGADPYETVLPTWREAESEEEISAQVGGYVWWIKKGDGLADEDDAEELAVLEILADGCEDREDAEQRILEDALSVEVRSGWTLPQAMHNAENWAEEFRIVLCTGGPHVQIRGELENGEPSRAWLEYQDWGTPMLERVNDDGDEEALLTYARRLYFGE